MNLVAATILAADLMGLDAPDPVPAAPLWLVLGLFALVEAAVIRLDIGGRPVVLVLRATPILAGLAYLAPVEVVAAHILGSTLALVARERPTPRRALAIVSANALGTVAAAVVFAVAVPLAGSVATWWLMACAAVTAASAAAVPGTIARWLPEGRPRPPGSIRAALAYGLIVSVVDASLAITIVIFLRSDASELWLLAGPALVAVASYRAWLGLRRRHARVEFLYSCARLLDGPSSGAAMLDDLLARTREAFRALEAELLLDEARGRRLHAAVGPADARRLLGLGTADPLGQRRAILPGAGQGALLRRGDAVPGIPSARAVVDAVVAGFEIGGSRSGTIAVIGQSDGRPFEADDVRLLESLAQGVGTALASSRMIEELGASVADLSRLAALVVPVDDRLSPAVADSDLALAGGPGEQDREPLAVGVIDGEFTWTRTNAPLCALLGASPDELVGHRFEVQLAREDIAQAHGLVSRLLRGESRGSAVEVHLRRVDNEEPVIATFLARLLVIAGREPSVLCVLVDVTEARLAEARERELDARVDAAILDLTAIRRPDIVLDTALRAAREVTGAVVAVARLDPPDPSVPNPMGAVGARATAALAAIAEPGRPRLRVPLRLAGGPGVLELVRETGEPAFVEDDQRRVARLATQAAVSIENAVLHERALALVNDLDTANAALQGASQARSRFLANVSHELRTPLHAILISAQLMADTSAAERDPGRVRNLPVTIDRTSRHLLRLIDDLVDLSRVELHDLRLEIVEQDLAPLLEDVRRQAEPLAVERGIGLSVASGAGIRVAADPVRLRQVMLNLLGNAIKYTEPGGRVRLVVAEGPGEVRLSVHDTGHGIEPEDLERAFLPFERLTAEGVPGAGLGLPIARRIMELHGGALAATSAPGSGSVFTAHLPAAAGPRRSHGSGAATTATMEGTP